MASRYETGPSKRPAAFGHARELLHGFEEFLRSPFAVGSAFPASSRLIEALLAPVDWSKSRVVVELGPGTGRFTRALLRRLSPQARLVAIDTSPGFIAGLTERICDARLHAIKDDAQNLRSVMRDLGLDTADAIISGIPFSSMSPACGRDIIEGCRSVLGPGGRMLAYQMRRSIEPLLHAAFCKVDEGLEWRNLPPCRLYWASRARPDHR